MTQLLIVDQKAMAMAQLETLTRLIAQVSAATEPKHDLNRKQMRANEARMRPIKLKLARLQAQFNQLQKKTEALLAENG